MKTLIAAALAALGLAAVCAAPLSVAQEAPAPAPPVGPSASAELQYSPVALADLIEKVCQAAEKDGARLSVLAKVRGLGDPREAPTALARALPEGVQTWSAPSADGALFLFAYGEEPQKCGAAVLGPLPGAGYQLALDLFQQPARGFVIDSSQMLNGGAKWTRLKSPAGQYIDLMDYPVDGGSPGILRADLLPN